jgi:hypothetical protein
MEEKRSLSRVVKQQKFANIQIRPKSGMLGDPRDGTLNRLGIRNVRDLLNYGPVHSARMLTAVARGVIPAAELRSLVKDEFLQEDASQAAGWPIIALRDVSPEEAGHLARMGVRSISDMAQMAQEAEESVLEALEDNGFQERPSAPAQLLPGMIGSINSNTRYTTFIRDTSLRQLALLVDPQCLTPLPISAKDKGRASLADIFLNLTCPVFHLGYICGHTQRWINLGTQLGEVVHSLSLAPGESRNIAYVNWRRQQLTALEERTTVRESLTATFIQNRAIEEITSAVAREHQKGNTTTEANTAVTAAGLVGSTAVVGALIGTIVEPGGGTAIGAGVGAGVGVVAGGLIWAGSQVFGKIEADTGGNRDIAAKVQQRISLSTSQTASAVRSLWSTVVVEDTQAESVEATTSTITNYNHMHALNIEYYEALQHYLARIDVESVQPLLFLPFTFFDFTGFKVVRDYWDIVRLHVEDEGLRTQGDSYFVTEKQPEEPDVLPVPPIPTPPTPGNPPTLKNLQIDVLFKSLPLGTDVGLDVMKGDTQISGEEKENGVGDEVDGYDWGNRYTFGEISEAQEITAVSLSRKQPVQADMRYRIRIHKGKLFQDGEELENLAGLVIASNKVILGSDKRVTFNIPWKPAADLDNEDRHDKEEYKKAILQRAMIIADNRARTDAYERLVRNIARFEKRLGNLLMRRRHFFTRVILDAIEPEEITQLLESVTIGLEENGTKHSGVPLSEIADTIPLGMTTGAFVLKLKRLDDTALKRLVRKTRLSHANDDIITLLTYANRTAAFFEDPERREAMAKIEHIYVPTGGLFAEAILGRANGSEYLDMERYFNWQDSPIPNQAPSINPVGTDSRFQQGDVNVTMPDGKLQVIQPVSLPDPTGMQGILTAIQNGGIFRDMSKSAELAGVVASLTALAGQMGQAASSMTGQAAQQALQAATDIGKTAAGLAQALGTEDLRSSNGTPANITNMGAALNKAQEQEKQAAASGNGSSAGSGTSRAKSGDIVGKAAGLPVQSGTSNERTLDVELVFFSGSGIPIPFEVASQYPKMFKLSNRNDLRVVVGDTPGSAEAGIQQMEDQDDPKYTFSLPRWSETNATLTVELEYGTGSFKQTLLTQHIPAKKTLMVIAAKFATRDVIVERENSVSRTQTLVSELQNKLGVSASEAVKILEVAEFGVDIEAESTESSSNTDSSQSGSSTRIQETLKVPTGALELTVDFPE